MGLSHQQELSAMISACRRFSLNNRYGITELPPEYVNVVQFARERIIVGLLLPRQSGKTTCGAWQVKNFLESGSSALLLTFNNQAAKSAQSTFNMPEGSVMSVQSFIAGANIKHPRSYGFVFIDEPSICFRNVSEYELLNLLVDKNNLASQEILMIGTY